MISKRQQHIINLLSERNEYITGKQLASILHVSDRTIRIDIAAINVEYGVPVIEASKRWGYRMDSKQAYRIGDTVKSFIPQNSKERCVYIIKELLFNTMEMNVIALQDQVFVSGYSIDNDIKKIKSMIAVYPSLKIVRSKNHISLEGREVDKRMLYEKLLKEETQGNFMNLNSIARLWDNFDLLDVKDILVEICETKNYAIKETDLPMIMIHAGVSIERIINGSYVHDQSHHTELLDSLDYHVSCLFFHEISKLLDIPYVEDEVSIFSLLLYGKRTNLYKKNVTTNKHKIDIDEVMKTLINTINEYFAIDFSEDQDFRIGFSMHLQSMLERYENKIMVTNNHLSEIKKSYPLIFEMAVRTGEVINDLCDVKVHENELAYIALHLGSAYERANVVKKTRTVLISPTNQALSKLCCDKLLQRFGERMEVVQCYGYFEESLIIDIAPDLIIATSAFSHNLSIMTVPITLFMNHEDESKVFQALNKIDKKRYHADFAKMITDLMKPELFHVLDCIDSREEAIDMLCNDLISRDLATQAYKEDVFKRESISATSFVSGFAIPHSVEVPANESCVSIMLLKDPLKWGEYNVSLIILLAIHGENNDLLRIFFDWLSGIVSDASKFSELLSIKEYDTFIKYVVSEE